MSVDTVQLTLEARRARRSLLLLLALAEHTTANLVLNPYTTTGVDETGVPPPDGVSCTDDNDCSGPCIDRANAYNYCDTDQTNRMGGWCAEATTAGTEGTPANACDAGYPAGPPSDIGFVECGDDNGVKVLRAGAA